MPRADTWDKIISSSCPRVDDGNELDIAIAPGTKTTDYFVPRPPASTPYFGAFPLRSRSLCSTRHSSQPRPAGCQNAPRSSPSGK